ncbi:MAG: hypothetical protein FJ144_12820 [Deltaproteobacteria bacterium]|nr:hypothetical protein [Deltaproteobacteria bacterium]
MILALAVLLRLLWLDAGWFGVDQARDLTFASEIASGRALPLVGPPMRNRFHLGATYYYFWTLPFLASTEPLAAYAFAGLLGVLAVGLTWLLARRIAGSSAGVAAALLLATSPIAVIDSRVAWAPAALPPLSAGLLLALFAVLERPSAGAALAVALLSALALQLHLAAAPLVLVAAATLFVRRRALGARSLGSAALVGLIAFSPALAALAVPTAPAGLAAPRAPTVDTWSDRLGDLLRVGARTLDGLLPPERPSWIDLVSGAEAAWIGFVLLCAVAILVRGGRSPAGIRLVVATFVATLVSVAVLPWEAWYYYLDGGLVPAAVIAGVAFASLGRIGGILVFAIAVVRTALLLWWMHAVHASGFLSTDLALLRVGSGAQTSTSQRARVLTVASRRDGFTALTRALGSVPEEVRSRAHGPGFADLDSDNGYFLGLAAASQPASSGDRAAVVVYANEVPDSWRSAMARPIAAGPLEIVVDESRLGAAVVDGCGTERSPLPTHPPTSPLAYGTGGSPRATWPCDSPIVTATVRARSGEPREGAHEVVRVFARVDGAGRVARLESEPPGIGIAASATGRLGAGIELRELPATVRVHLELQGPATLDLFELRGE